MSEVLSFSNDTNIAELRIADGEYGIFMRLAPTEPDSQLQAQPYLSLIAQHDASKCGRELGDAHRLNLPADVVDFYLTAIGDPTVAIHENWWPAVSRVAYTLHVASQMAIANGWQPGAEAPVTPPSAE